MQKGEVDMVLVGVDRLSAKGDCANKIGTYLKALAAKDNQVPFYVACPSTTIDWSILDGLKDIPIETRSPEEVSHIQGWHEGAMKKVRIMPESSEALNIAFDVTPNHLITGIITEKGMVDADQQSLEVMFSKDYANNHG